MDAFHTRLQEAFKKHGPCQEVDDMLNACDDPYGECPTCSIIICPHKDSFHFHHDGCPACAEPVAYTDEQVAAMNAAL